MVVWACLCVGGASENFLLKTRYINSLFDWLIWLIALPMIVMDGLKRPFGRNKSSISSLANGLLGFGSNGVPSIRVHGPTIVFQPRMLYNMQQCSYKQNSIRQLCQTTAFCRHSLSVWHTAVLETGTLPLQHHKSGTVCRPVSDYVGCHMASSGGHWRYFYLDSEAAVHYNCF